MRVPSFHGANDEVACLDWLDIQFGRSTRKWSNILIFQWDWNKWRADSKQTVDLSRYPMREATDTFKLDGNPITSVADWQKKAEQVHKSVQWMLGPSPVILSVADLDAQRRLRRPAVAGGANPGQVTPIRDDPSR
jgi:hypothetical protein